ncbi:hypothetical protein P261_01342 [Lachnospiraceae bacterium TWA4]|nr:hypothetical protein P261_01342 [Lachnospiraceae bacterium TWA4]
MSEIKEKYDKVKYNRTYNKNNYDRIQIVVPKGQREIIRSHATNNNESLNAFIIRAINQLIDSENSTSSSTIIDNKKKV